ncbi:MAG: AAA family ATPase [Tahibacter sp.]
MPTPLPQNGAPDTHRERMAVEPATPVVVALIGLPGAGKSVVSRSLVDQLGLRCVDRDAIRHAMFPRCSYSFVEKRAAFRSLLLALEINCMLGVSSVIDGCTFSRRADLLRVDQVVRRYRFRAIPVFLDCPAAVARARIVQDIASDVHVARDRNPDVVGEVLSRMEAPPPGSLTIDATLPATEVCRLVVQSISALLRPEA